MCSVFGIDTKSAYRHRIVLGESQILRVRSSGRSYAAIKLPNSAIYDVHFFVAWCLKYISVRDGEFLNTGAAGEELKTTLTMFSVAFNPRKF